MGKRVPLTDPNDDRHGTSVAWSHHGCRCDKCRQFARMHQAQYRTTEAGRSKSNGHNQASQLRARLAARWVKTHRPEIWQEICATVQASNEERSVEEARRG